MNEIQLQDMLTHDTNHATEPPLPDDFVATSLHLARQRASRHRRARVAGTGAAVLTAAAITIGVVGANAPTGNTHPHGNATSHHPAAAAPGTAQALLGRVSLAADDQTLTVRDDQFIYTDILSDHTVKHPTKDKPALPPRHDKEWVSVDGSRPGRAIGPGKDTTIPVTGTPASLDNPNYHFLETLPTDPDELLAMLRAQRGMYKQTVSPDDALWMSLDTLINQSPVLPPKLAAALY